MQLLPCLSSDSFSGGMPVLSPAELPLLIVKCLIFRRLATQIGARSAVDLAVLRPHTNTHVLTNQDWQLCSACDRQSCL